MSRRTPPQAPWTTRRVLAWTQEELERRKVDSPRLDAEVLLAEALGVTRLQLYLDMDKPLRPDELTTFKAMVRRRAAREPVSLILGRREFWGRPFTVTADVLCPRPETEGMVEDVLLHLKRRPGGTPAILDVGTGSGCLAVTLALELPGSAVTAVDISAPALETARRNAQALGAGVTFLLGDMAAPLPPGAVFDVVVSNPPYLTEGEWAEAPPEVRLHEPRVALVGADQDGLGHHRALAAGVWPRVGPGGVLWAELGAEQGVAAVRLWEVAVGASGRVALLKDLAGKDRVVRVARLSP
jgi:release factor glutamine methyltransferase